MPYVRCIIKDRETFDTVDYPYCYGISVSDPNQEYTVSYYTDSTMGTTASATYNFNNYYIYVVPAD